MADERLRELERRWQETGAVEEEAAYLLERVRVGDLAQERLELAASLGFEASTRALGLLESSPPPSAFAQLYVRSVFANPAANYTEDPWPFSGEAGVRVCLAAVETALSESGCAAGLEATIEQIHRWLDSPEELTSERAWGIYGDYSWLFDAMGDLDDLQPEEHSTLMVVKVLEDLMGAAVPGDSTFLNGWQFSPDAFWLASRLVHDGSLASGVRERLAPWLFGRQPSRD